MEDLCISNDRRESVFLHTFGPHGIVCTAVERPWFACRRSDSFLLSENTVRGEAVYVGVSRLAPVANAVAVTNIVAPVGWRRNSA